MANREKVYMLTKGRCFYCGCQLNKEDFHMDHFYPRQRGGKEKDNLVPCCRDCNLCKSNLSIEGFRNKISDYVNDTFYGRIISKYYGVEKKEIRFFFEEVENGLV